MRDRFTLNTTDTSKTLEDTTFLCKNYILANDKTYKMSNGVVVSFNIDGDVTEKSFVQDEEKTYSNTYRFCNDAALKSYNSFTQNTYRYRSLNGDKNDKQKLSHELIEMMKAFGTENSSLSITFDFTNAAFTTDIEIEKTEKELYPFESRQYLEGDIITIYVLAITDSISVSGLTDYIVEPAFYIYNSFNEDSTVDDTEIIYRNNGFDTYTNYNELKFNTADFGYTKYNDNNLVANFTYGYPGQPYYHRYSDKRAIRQFNKNISQLNNYTDDNTERFTFIKITGKLDNTRKVIISNVKRITTNVNAANVSSVSLTADQVKAGKVNSIRATINRNSSNNKYNYVRAYIEQVDKNGIVRRHYSNNIVSLKSGNNFYTDEHNAKKPEEGSTLPAGAVRLAYQAPSVWQFSNTYIENSDIVFGLFYAADYLDGNFVHDIDANLPHNKIGVYSIENNILNWREYNENEALKFNFNGDFEISYDECDDELVTYPELYIAFADIGEYDDIYYDTSKFVNIDETYDEDEFNIKAIIPGSDGILKNYSGVYNTDYNVLVANELILCYSSTKNSLEVKCNTTEEEKEFNLNKINDIEKDSDTKLPNNYNNLPLYFNDNNVLTLDTKKALSIPLIDINQGFNIDRKSGEEYYSVSKIVEGASITTKEKGELISAINIDTRIKYNIGETETSKDNFYNVDITEKVDISGNASGIQYIDITGITDELLPDNKLNYALTSISLKCRDYGSGGTWYKGEIYLAIYNGDTCLTISKNSQAASEYGAWYRWEFNLPNAFKLINKDNINLRIKPIEIDEDGNITTINLQQNNWIGLKVKPDNQIAQQYGIHASNNASWVPAIRFGYTRFYYSPLTDFEHGLNYADIDLSKEGGNNIFEGDSEDITFKDITDCPLYNSGSLVFNLNASTLINRKLKNNNNEYSDARKYYFKAEQQGSITKYIPTIVRPGLIVDGFKTIEAVVIDSIEYKCHRYYDPNIIEYIYDNIQPDNTYIIYDKVGEEFIKTDRTTRFPYSISLGASINGSYSEYAFINEDGQSKCIYSAYTSPLAAILDENNNYIALYEDYDPIAKTVGDKKEEFNINEFIPMLSKESVKVGKPYNISFIDKEGKNINEIIPTHSDLEDDATLYRSFDLGKSVFDNDINVNYFSRHYTPLNYSAYVSENGYAPYIILKNLYTNIIFNDNDANSESYLVASKSNSLYTQAGDIKKVQGAWNNVPGQYYIYNDGIDIWRIEIDNISYIIDNEKSCLVIKDEDIGEKSEVFDEFDEDIITEDIVDTLSEDISSLNIDDNSKDIPIATLPAAIQERLSFVNKEVSNNILSNQYFVNPDLKNERGDTYSEQIHNLNKELCTFKNFYNIKKTRIDKGDGTIEYVIDKDWLYVADYSSSTYNPFNDYFTEKSFYGVKPRYSYLHARIKNGKLEFAFFDEINTNYEISEDTLIAEPVTIDGIKNIQADNINDIFKKLTIASKEESERKLIKNGKLIISAKPQFAGYMVDRGIAEVELNKITESDKTLFCMPFYGHIWTYWYSIINNRLYFVGLPLYTKNHSSYIAFKNNDGVFKKYNVNLPFTDSELIDGLTDPNSEAAEYLDIIKYIGGTFTNSETLNLNGGETSNYHFNFFENFDYVSFLNDERYTDYSIPTNIIDVALAKTQFDGTRIKQQFHGDIITSASDLSIEYPYVTMAESCDKTYFTDELDEKIGESFEDTYKLLAITPRLSRSGYKLNADWLITANTEKEREFIKKSDSENSFYYELTLTAKNSSGSNIPFASKQFKIVEDDNDEFKYKVEFINENNEIIEDNNILLNAYENIDGNICLYIIPRHISLIESNEFYSEYNYALYRCNEDGEHIPDIEHLEYSITKEEISNQHYTFMLVGDILSGYKYGFNKARYGFEINTTSAFLEDYLESSKNINDSSDIKIFDKNIKISIDIEYYNIEELEHYDAIFKPIFEDDIKPDKNTKYTWILKDKNGEIIASHVHTPGEDASESIADQYYCYWDCKDILKYEPEYYTVELTIEHTKGIGKAEALVTKNSSLSPVIISKDFNLEINRTNIRLQENGYNLDLISNIISKNYIIKQGTKYNWEIYVGDELFASYEGEDAAGSKWENISQLFEYGKEYKVILTAEDPQRYVASASIKWVINNPNVLPNDDLTLLVDITRDNVTFFENTYSADFTPHLTARDTDIYYTPKQGTTYKWNLKEIEYDDNGNIIEETNIKSYQYNSISSSDKCSWHVDNLSYQKHYIVECEVIDPDKFEGNGIIESYIESVDTKIDFEEESKSGEIVVDITPVIVWQEENIYCADFKPILTLEDGSLYEVQLNTEFNWTITDADGKEIYSTTYISGKNDEAILDDIMLEYDKTYYVQLTVKDPDDKEGTGAIRISKASFEIPDAIKKTLDLDIYRENIVFYINSDIASSSDTVGYYNDINSKITTKDYILKPGREYSWNIWDDFNYKVNSDITITDDKNSILESNVIGLLQYNTDYAYHYYYTTLKVVDAAGNTGFIKIRFNQDEPKVEPPTNYNIDVNISTNINTKTDTYYLASHKPYFADTYTLIPDGTTLYWELIDLTNNEVIESLKHTYVYEADECIWYSNTKLSYGTVYGIKLTVTDSNGKSGVAYNEIFVNYNNYVFKATTNNIAYDVVNRITPNFDVELSFNINLECINLYGVKFGDDAYEDVEIITYIDDILYTAEYDSDTKKYKFLFKELEYDKAYDLDIIITGKTTIYANSYVADIPDVAKLEDAYFYSVYNTTISPEEKYILYVSCRWNSNDDKSTFVTPESTEPISYFTSDAIITFSDNSPVDIGTYKIKISLHNDIFGYQKPNEFILSDDGNYEIVYDTPEDWKNRNELVFPEIPVVIEQGAANLEKFRLRITAYERNSLTSVDPDYGPYNNRIFEYEYYIAPNINVGPGPNPGPQPGDADWTIIFIGGGGGSRGKHKHTHRSRAIYESYYVFVGNLYETYKPKRYAAKKFTPAYQVIEFKYDPKIGVDYFNVYEPYIRNLFASRYKDPAYAPYYISGNLQSDSEYINHKVHATPVSVPRAHDLPFLYDDLVTNGIRFRGYQVIPYKETYYEYLPGKISNIPITMYLTHKITNIGTHKWNMKDITPTDGTGIETSDIHYRGENTMAINFEQFYDQNFVVNDVPQTEEYIPNEVGIGRLPCNFISKWRTGKDGQNHNAYLKNITEYDNRKNSATCESSYIVYYDCEIFRGDIDNSTYWCNDEDPDDITNRLNKKCSGLISIFKNPIRKKGALDIKEFGSIRERYSSKNKVLVRFRLHPYCLKYRIIPEPFSQSESVSCIDALKSHLYYYNYSYNETKVHFAKDKTGDNTSAITSSDTRTFKYTKEASQSFKGNWLYTISVNYDKVDYVPSYSGIYANYKLRRNNLKFSIGIKSRKDANSIHESYVDEYLVRHAVTIKDWQWVTLKMNEVMSANDPTHVIRENGYTMIKDIEL